VATEVGDGLEVRREPSREPHHLDIAPRLSFEPAARLNLIEIAIQVELQQQCGMIARAPCRSRNDSGEAERSQVEFIDERVHNSHRIVVTDVIVKTARKQHDLMTVSTLNESRHEAPVRSAKAIKNNAFSHSLGGKPTFDVRAA
jgi:hypothetical protein